MSIAVDKVVDAKGLACPMPIVKTKKALDDIQPGQVTEVQATDRGSTADIEAWAKSSGHQYLGTIEAGDILKHYVRKSDPKETKEVSKHAQITRLDELRRKVENGEAITILDVREPAEYAFRHIPGAKSIPMGQLEKRIGELNRDDEIHIICRTGNRSDLAAQLLAKNGFKNVNNVVPGMTEWTGPTEKHNGR